MRQKVWTGLLLAPLLGTGALAKERAGYDAFLESRGSQPLAVSEQALQSRGLRVSHAEERLGVPTFLWSEREATGTKAGLSAEQAARAWLQESADVYRLQRGDLSGAVLHSLHQTGRGPVIARFQQKVDGIEVFRNELKVVMDQGNELVAMSGYLASSEALRQARTARFQLSAQEALARALRDLSGLAFSADALVPTGQQQGDYAYFDHAPGARNLLTQHLTEPARARKVFFTLPDRIEPAWYVELEAGARDNTESAFYSYVISAADGALLLRNDLRAHDSYTYRVYADPSSYLPYDGPQGTEATPHPTGIPDGFTASFVPSSLVTLQNYPFSRNDPWLPINATQSTGNNADAYVDLGAPDGYQPGVDLRAPVSAPGSFDYTFDPTRSPAVSADQRLATVVNLFYVNNFLHDWYYDAGFDEASGNAQAFNYGRGGLENDSLRAEAQDYGGRNNANMATPADGFRPRMQMYIFDGRPQLTVNAPAAIAGPTGSGSASFGPTAFNLTGDVSILNPAGATLGCTAFAAGTFTGKIAVLDRGTCNFSLKAFNAQNAGAVGVVIANNTAGPAPGLGGTDPAVTIPVLSISLTASNSWKAQAAGGATINITMVRGPDLDRDGTLDNDIIAHEWGHYISNRLIGNANGLINPQGRAMGEGWSDFHALLLQVRESDRNRPGNNQYQGLYTVGAYATSASADNSYYFGIRRLPYSTDFTKNALTFKHISNGVPLPATHPVAFGGTGVANSAVHSTGEVWATMLWECYASLLNAYPFQEAQDRMKQYLVAAYKVTPASPTILEARDALLSVAAASDAADYMRFVQAFAKRGAGFGAKGPDRNSQDFIGAVESFVSGNNLEVVSIHLDDSVAGCDVDGVLDVGETGLLTVTVRNVGAGILPPFSGTVTASGATATLAFPNGNTLSFPSMRAMATTTARVPVRLTAVSGTTPRAGITLTFNEPSLPTSAQTASFDGRVHYDEQLGMSATDNAEASQTAWSSSFLNRVPAFQTRGDTTNRYYHVDNPSVPADLALFSPWLRVNATGNFTFSFKQRWSFETSNGGGAPFFDGGVIEITTDGINWVDLIDYGVVPGYTAFLATGGANPLAGRPALVALSPGFPNWVTQNVNLGTRFAGQQVRLRFRLGADDEVGAYGWDLDDIAFNNVSTMPFGTLALETSDGTTCNRRPVANPGLAQAVLERQTAAPYTLTTITLDGSASFDPDGSPLTYQWTQLSGPPVTLQNANTVAPSFTADVRSDSVLTFQLVVNDGADSSQPVPVQVTVVNVNRPPVAAPTAPATVPERSTATVQLSGSGSTDPDGEALTYSWGQTGGPAVTLSGADTATPSFNLPEVSADTQYTFALTVSDGVAQSSATVAVTVTNVDRAPTANAGMDQRVAGRTPVTLSASANDADGDAITYAWTQTGGTPSVTLQGADTAMPTFTSPDVKAETTLTFEVTATANGVQATDTVSVTVEADRAPTVNAGMDLRAAGRTAVTLSASASDADGDAITYAWTQTGGLPLVTLQGADTAMPTFTSPDVKMETTLSFQVTVSANGLQSTDAIDVIIAADGAPTASAGSDQSVAARSTVTLAGSGSDPEGDTLTYAWTQTGGSPVTLQGADTAMPTFTAPDVRTPTPEVLTFQLTITANGLQATDTVSVTVNKANRRPVAQGPNALTENERTALTLSAAESTDPDGDTLTYAWTQTGGPLVTLTGADTASLSFTTPEVQGDTLLVFKLSATDPDGASSEVTVTITVKNVDRAPVANAGADREVEARSTVSLSGSGSDPDGDAVTYAWRQVSGTEVTLTGADTATPSFTAPDVRTPTPEVLTFELTVTANGQQVTDTVSISVRKANRHPVAKGPNTLTENERTALTLSASESMDPDDDALSYEWTQTGGPAVVLTGANTASLSFTTPEVLGDTQVSFRLVVRDADGASSEATVIVTVKNVNRKPTATPAQAAGGLTKELVTLDGSASVDPDGDTLSYEWRQTAGTPVTLSATDKAVTTFKAPETNTPLELTFELTVRDGKGESAVQTLTVTINPPAGGCSSTGPGSPGFAMPLALLALGLLAARKRTLA